jgi:hypothetical protein
MPVGKEKTLTGAKVGKKQPVIKTKKRMFMNYPERARI